MTELIQPLGDVGPVRHVPAQSRDSAHPAGFSELVYAHYDWWRSRESGKPDSAAAAAYDSVRTAFQARHGEIIRAYWCTHVESAVALTERKRLGGPRPPPLCFPPATPRAAQNTPRR